MASFKFSSCARAANDSFRTGRRPTKERGDLEIVAKRGALWRKGRKPIKWLPRRSGFDRRPVDRRGFVPRLQWRRQEQECTESAAPGDLTPSMMDLPTCSNHARISCSYSLARSPLTSCGGSPPHPCDQRQPLGARGAPAWVRGDPFHFLFGIGDALPFYHGKTQIPFAGDFIFSFLLPIAITLPISRIWRFQERMRPVASRRNDLPGALPAA
jgi:hypothetical protein